MLTVITSVPSGLELSSVCRRDQEGLGLCWTAKDQRLGCETGYVRAKDTVFPTCIWELGVFKPSVDAAFRKLIKPNRLRSASGKCTGSALETQPCECVRCLGSGAGFSQYLPNLTSLLLTGWH